MTNNQKEIVAILIKKGEELCNENRGRFYF
jgi:hypothetical protein